MGSQFMCFTLNLFYYSRIKLNKLKLENIFIKIIFFVPRKVALQAWKKKISFHFVLLNTNESLPFIIKVYLASLIECEVIKITY